MNERWFASRRDDAVAGLCGAWMVVGLFADGWAHRNQKPETFFSPWHGLLYSGFAASAVWMLRVARRGQAAGHRSSGRLPSMPVGYGLRIAGVALFGAAGLADFAWHSIFGIEVNVEALLSPPHLALLSGGLLMAAGPIASTLARGHDGARSTWRRDGALVASATFIVCVLGFFLMYASPYDYGRYDRLASDGIWTADRYDLLWRETIAIGVAGILVFALITTLVVQWVIRSDRRPVGAVALLLVLPPLLLSSLTSFDEIPRLLGVVVAALLAEVTASLWSERLRSSVTWLAGWIAGLTLVSWFGFFGGIALGSRVAWSAELWSGSCALAALLSALTVIVTAPVPRRRA